MIGINSEILSKALTAITTVTLSHTIVYDHVLKRHIFTDVSRKGLKFRCLVIKSLVFCHQFSPEMRKLEE